MQGSYRTGWYGALLQVFTSLQWIGLAPGQKRPAYHALHTSTRFAQQLKRAGLNHFKKEELHPDLSWLKVDVSRFKLPDKSILLVPGSSKTGHSKRWPAAFYRDLANRLLRRDYTPVLIGGPDEVGIVQEILQHCPKIMNLVGKTNFFEIAGLARHAKAIVGNDTGPTHLGAAVGCPSLFLWSKASEPKIYAPQGAHIRVLYQEDLKDLPVDKVEKTLTDFFLN